MLKEFREFILRGNLVDLAVAVVIGTAFGAVVTALVADLITPIDRGRRRQARLQRPRLHDQRHRRSSTAHFINALITFLSIAAAVFFFVVKPVNALMARLKSGRPVDERRARVPGVRQRDPGQGLALRVLHRSGDADGDRSGR